MYNKRVKTPEGLTDQSKKCQATAAAAAAVRVYILN